MKELMLLVRAQLVTRLRPDKSAAKRGNGKIAVYIILGLSYLTIIGMISGVLSMAAVALAGTEYIADLVLFIYLGGVMLVLMFGISSLITYVYMGRDNEFLAGLPVAPGKVFMSKLVVIYLYEFVTTFAIIAVPLLVVGISSMQGVIYYIVLLISTMFVPALPIVLASIIAIPLMYVVSFFKSKGAASTIAGMFLYVMFFAVYMVFVFWMQKTAGNIDTDPVAMSETFAKLQRALNVFHNAVYPLYALACVATGVDNLGLGAALGGLANMGIAIGSLVVLYFAAYLISSLVYSKSALAQGEAAKSSGVKGEYRSAGGVIKSLVIRDFKEVLRTTAFGFQYLLGIIMSPLMVVFMTVMYSSAFSSGGAEADAISRAMNVIMPFFMVWMLGAGMNMAAATAISREGKKFYIGKLLPVTPQEQIKAKLILSMIIGYVSVVLSLIAMYITGLRGYEAFFVPVILLLHTAGFAMFALRYDLSSPKLNWTNPTEAVKHNRSANIPTFINMGAGFVLLIGGIVVYGFSIYLSPFLSELVKILFWVVTTGLVIAEVLVTRHLLFRDAVKFYERLEV